MGLKLDAAPSQETQLWPENLWAFNVFYRLRTQWNVGMVGVIGLRNESLQFALQLEAVPPTEWADVVTDVQTMESETLRLWRKKSQR